MIDNQIDRGGIIFLPVFMLRAIYPLKCSLLSILLYYLIVRSCENPYKSVGGFTVFHKTTHTSCGWSAF
nr:MAG TPA: hypothetical protein [Caudoviricetes sp.]